MNPVIKAWQLNNLASLLENDSCTKPDQSFAKIDKARQIVVYFQDCDCNVPGHSEICRSRILADAKAKYGDDFEFDEPTDLMKVESYVTLFEIIEALNYLDPTEDGVIPIGPHYKVYRNEFINPVLASTGRLVHDFDGLTLKNFSKFLTGLINQRQLNIRNVPRLTSNRWRIPETNNTDIELIPNIEVNATQLPERWTPLVGSIIIDAEVMYKVFRAAEAIGLLDERGNHRAKDEKRAYYRPAGLRAILEIAHNCEAIGFWGTEEIGAQWIRDLFGIGYTDRSFGRAKDAIARSVAYKEIISHM